MNIHRSSGRWRLGLGLALFTALVWGSLPIGLKILLDGLDPYTITWSRFLMAAGLLALMGAHGARPPLRTVGRGYWLLLLVGSVGMTGNYLFYVLGLDYISPATAQTLIQLAPIFMLIGSLVLFRERFARLQWLGFAVLIGGLALYFDDRLAEIFSGFQGLTRGLLLILVSGVSWATYALSQKQLLGLFRPNFILFVFYLSGGLFLWPLAAPERLLGQSFLRLVLLVGAAVSTVISYRTFAGALEHLEGSRVSIVISLTPLVALAGTALVAPFVPDLIRPEMLDATSLLGAGLVVAGSMMTALGRRKKGGKREME